MSLRIDITNKFALASFNDPSLQKQKPIIEVDPVTFHQVLEPVLKVMLKYGASEDRYITLEQQMTELRGMCVEAHSAHTIEDSQIKNNRAALVDAQQGIIEKIQESNGGDIFADHDDMNNIKSLTVTLRDCAKIYREYMNYPDVANSLDLVSDNIDMAQARNWLPESSADHKSSTTADAANEEHYGLEFDNVA